MSSSSDSESCQAESNASSFEECHKSCDLVVGMTNRAHLTGEGTDEHLQQLDGGRTVDSVRSSLSNFRQSASRTTGQIRELLETSKALDRDLVSFLHDPQTRAFLEYFDDLEDNDNNLLDIGDEGSTDNPKEVEALKQKTKSLKRKLRKWRKAARMALSEICPDMTADAQGDMTPGTMKNVLQKIRQLKSLTERQTSIIMTLNGQREQQKAESIEKDSLIMELLKNCNGIRPSLTNDNQTETLATGVCNLEGMVTRHENIDYQLISAAEVEEVLNQPGIQFGSSHLIPTQLQNESGANTVFSGEIHASDLAPSMETNNNEQQQEGGGGGDPPETMAIDIPPMTLRNMSGSSSVKTKTVWWGAAVATACLGTMLMGNLSRRVSTNNN